MDDWKAFERALDQAEKMMRLHRWAVRMQIVRLVHQAAKESPDGWARLGTVAIAEHLGISKSYVWQLMGTGASSKGLLWRVERVLWKASIGRGSAGTQWRVNPDIEGWRNVPWLVVDPMTRATLLEAARADLYRAGARYKASVVPRASAVQRAPLYRAARGTNGRSGDPLHRAPARYNRPLDPAAARGASDLSPGGPSSYASRFTPARVDEPCFSEEQQRSFVALVQAIDRRCAPESVWPGSKVERLLWSTVGHPLFELDRALAVVEGAGAELGPWLVVNELHRDTLGIAPVAPTRELERVELRRRAEVLESVAATYWADGGEPPEDLLAELEAVKLALMKEEPAA